MMRQSDLDDEGSRREFLEVLGGFDTPAYIQRGQRTAEAYRHFMANCDQHRSTRLEFCCLRLAKLAAMIGGQWVVVGDYANWQARVETGIAVPRPATSVSEYLSGLHRSWQPKLRTTVSPTESPKRIRRAAEDLAKSFERFNVIWERYLTELDFTEINRIRADYNNYYICEKAAAMQSERLASLGFEELPLLSRNDVALRYPLLSVPLIR